MNGHEFDLDMEYMLENADFSANGNSNTSYVTEDTVIDNLITEATSLSIQEASDSSYDDTEAGDLLMSGYLKTFLHEEAVYVSELGDERVLAEFATGNISDATYNTLLSEGKTKTKTKFDLAARLMQFTGSSALALAREKKDPLFAKMMKFRVLYLTYKRAIGKKYAGASIRRAKDVLKKYKANKNKHMPSVNISSLSGRK